MKIDHYTEAKGVFQTYHKDTMWDRESGKTLSTGIGRTPQEARENARENARDQRVSEDLDRNR
jgi:hypothetical protein